MKNILISAARLTALALLICYFSAGSGYAQPKRQADLTALIREHANWNPGQFILEKLETNRIVMVGISKYGDPLYSRVVVNALNDWVSAWERPGRKPAMLPSKMFLFLEMDSVQASGLKQYFATGDPLLTIVPFDFTSYNYTTGMFEFYYQLRLIKQRVDAFNEHRIVKNQILFDVAGPEQVIDQAVWTPAWRDSFFVYRRDKYSSSRIERLLTASPGAKALVYYGQGHLATEEMEKSADKVSAPGYYLAHYLEQDFGSKGGVYTCEQLDVDAMPGRFDRGLTAVGKMFAIDDSVFTGVPVGLNQYLPWMDGAIFYFTPSRHTRGLPTLYSENLIDYIMENIDSYRNMSREYNSWVIGAYLNYLSGAAGEPFRGINYNDQSAVDSAIAAWKKWGTSTKLDFVGDITSLRFFEKYIDVMRNSKYIGTIPYERMMLSKQVGFYVHFPMGTPAREIEDGTWSQIVKYRKPIVIENLVDLLWVASPSEKKEAVAFLKKETGKDFTTAQGWSSWWEAQEEK